MSTNLESNYNMATVLYSWSVMAAVDTLMHFGKTLNHLNLFRCWAGEALFIMPSWGPKLNIALPVVTRVLVERGVLESITDLKIWTVLQ